MLDEEGEQIARERNLGKKLNQFTEAFSAKYFPLHDVLIDIMTDEYCRQEMDSNLFMMDQGIPVETYGYSDEDLHDAWDQLGEGVCMMIVLCEWSPHAYFGPDQGIRVSTATHMAGYLDPDILDAMPEDGYDRKKLMQTLSDTGRPGLADVVLWLEKGTNNPFMDCGREIYEDLSFPPWDRQQATALAQEWRAAKSRLDRMWHELDLAEANIGGTIKSILATMETPTEDDL